MSLSDIMEFDHVIRVDEFGKVHDVSGVWAPQLYDDELVSDGWALMDGYSGQSGYSGPIMHASELIGGAMERDILEQPGLYVALVNYLLDDTEPDGWAVAYKEG